MTEQRLMTGDFCCAATAVLFLVLGGALSLGGNFYLSGGLNALAGLFALAAWGILKHSRSA